LEQFDGFCIIVELGIREGKVGYGRFVPVVQSVGQFELRYCRAEFAFSEENGTECSMTGSYGGCKPHEFCKLDMGGAEIVSLIGG
jgi:hypothetical protein